MSDDLTRDEAPVGKPSRSRTLQAWEPGKPKWQLIPDAGTQGRRRLLRRIAFGLPLVLLASWSVGAAVHEFATRPMEVGFAFTGISLFMSRFLYRRSLGLPASFGASSITPKSSPVTIDSVETMAIVGSAGWVVFSVVIWFVPLP